MPSTAGVTIGLPPARAALEAVQRSVRLRRAYTISNAQKQETRWGAAFPGNIGPMLMIGVTGSPFGATAARFSRHLPVTSQHLLLSDRLLGGRVRFVTIIAPNRLMSEDAGSKF